MMPISDDTSEQKNRSSVGNKESISYEVKNHDTLCKIAVNYNTTTSYLRKLNKLTSTMIFPGQVLQVPFVVKKKQKEEDISSDDLSLSFASNIENAYAFLSPLSLSENENYGSSPKPFKDLCMVSSSDQIKSSDQGASQKQRTLSNSNKLFGAETLEAFKHPSFEKGQESTCNVKGNRERLASIESLSSEPFEENFLKLNVHYLNEILEHVRGILLVTPTSTMFDPDPSCPMAKEHGCEKFGMICDMKNILSLAMYRDVKEASSAENQPSSNDPSMNDEIDNRDRPEKLSGHFTSDGTFTPVHIDGHDLTESDPTPDEDLVKDVKHSAPTDPNNTLAECSPQSEFLYFCIRSTQPMMKTFSVLSALSDNADNVNDCDEKDVKEAWFHVPRQNSDQLMAFFMQWNPDPYALDFAEQNGFMVADSVERKKKKKPRKNERKWSRSSTSTSSSSGSSACSSDFTVSSEHENLGDKKVEKEWELVSIEEARRRSELNANELANDDTSLIPELRHNSNLIKDNTLLELCKRMPARCIGCPWKLLYSTFEHGMSLRTLYRKMDQRSPDEHPVFIIVQDTDGYTFGAFTSSSPHMSDHFYGSGESFLFTLEPEVAFFDWSGENNFFIKGNSDALVVGGGDGSAGLWIDGDLHHGRSRPCLTFNNSLLSLKEDFLIQDVEVWGFEDN